MRARLLLTSLALVLPPICCAQRVLIAPVEVQDTKAFPTQVKAQTQQNIADAIENALAVDLHRAGAQMVKPVQVDQLRKPMKEGLKKDPFGTLATLASDASVDYVVAIVVTRWSQRDRSVGEVMESPNKPASETTAEVRIWIYDAKATSLASDGNRATKSATAGGQHIGTQNQREMSGSPEDKGHFINLINKQRAGYVAKAVWQAIYRDLATATGLTLTAKK